MFDCQRVFYRQSQCSTANKKRRLSTGGFEAVTPCHHWKAREMRNIPSQVKLAWERCQRHTWHSYPNDLIYWRPPTESTKWCGKILRSSVKFGTCLLQITCIFCLPRQPKFLTPWVWCTETDRRVSCRWLRGMGWLLKNFWAVLVVPKRHPFWRFWWSCLMLFAACKIPLASLAHVTAQSATESMAGDVSTALVALASPKWLKTTWGLRDASGVYVSIPRFAWFVLSNYHWFGEHVIPPGQTCSTGWYWLQLGQKNHEISGWRPMASYGYGTIGPTIDRLFGNGKMMEDGSLHSMRSPWPS